MTEGGKRMSIEQIEAVALELPGEELDELINRLAAHRGMDPEVEQGWLEEVQRRVAAYDGGEVGGIAMEETLAKLRAILAARSRRRGTVRQAWIDEAERRMELVRAGQMRLLDADEVLADPDYDD